MGGKKQKASTSESKPVLLPEQKRIWDFLTSQLIPQSLGKETQATQIATQRARDEGALQLSGQQQQINQMATQGFGSAQRARLMSDAQNSALQNTLRSILGQRQAAQNQGMSLLAGMPIQPGQKTVQQGGTAAVEGAGSKLLGMAAGAAGTAIGGPIGGAVGGAAGKAVGGLIG